MFLTTVFSSFEHHIYFMMDFTGDFLLNEVIDHFLLLLREKLIPQIECVNVQANVTFLLKSFLSEFKRVCDNENRNKELR